MKKDIYKQPVLMNLAGSLSVPQSWCFSEAQPVSARPVFYPLLLVSLFVIMITPIIIRMTGTR